MSPTRTFAAVISSLALMLGLAAARAQEAAPPPSVSEIPASFTPKTDSFDFVRRDEMVAMRDGVKLRTIVLVPKGARARRSCSPARRTTPPSAWRGPRAPGSCRWRRR